MGKIQTGKTGKATYTVVRYNSKGEKVKEVKSMSELTKKKSSTYFADRMIVPRVEQYLEENKDKLKVDIDEMVDHLRKVHKDYGKKKRGPFKANVEKAFAAVLKKHELKDAMDSSDESLGEEEEEDEDDDDDDEMDLGLHCEDEEEEGLSDVEGTGGYEEGEIPRLPDSDTEPELGQNIVNSSLVGMYKADKTPGQRNASQELINISSDDDEKDDKPKPASQKAASMNGKVMVQHRLATIASSSRRPGPASSNQQRLQLAQAHQNAQQIAAARKRLITQSMVGQPASALAQGTANKPAARKGKYTVTCMNGTRFQDVGGCAKVLKDVTQLVIHLQHPEIFHSLGVSPPRGFLLHGPPGTGKTHLVHAIAGELKVPLIKVAAPELVSSLSGGSEERIRELFEQALALTPCIIFLDEVDAITPHRDTAHREMERRIVAQLLSSLDELGKTPAGNGVLVIGATNRPDAIDPALRRAGRFDREICLGIPDRDARRDILHLLSGKLRLAPTVSLDKIAMATPGYVGADLKALLTEAAMAAVSRLINDKLKSSTADKEPNDVKMDEDSSGEALPTGTEAAGGEPVAKKRKTDGDHTGNEIEVLPGDESKQPTEETEKKEQEGSKGLATETSDEAATRKEGSTLPSLSADVSSPIRGADKDDREKVDEGKVVEEKDKVEGDKDTVEEDKDKVEEDEVIVDDEANKVLLEKERIRLLKNQESNLLSREWKISRKELHALYIDEVDFLEAMKRVQPSAKREGFATVPDVTWDDVGSLKDIRQELKMTIMAPVQHPDAFAALGLNIASGVLLCGPPGCGKTLLAKAIANEAGINFISVKGPELLNMYVGESERAVRQCFLRARNSQPCVIFFDELDALCPKRSDFGDGGASTRVVNQLLTEMDGVEGRVGVFLMAATNRPDIIDPAVLRPGRLDKILYVGLPAPADRVDILKALTKDGTRPVLADDVSLEAVGHSEMCTGYTGADLSSLVREAGIASLKEYMENGPGGPLVVAARHFTAALNKIRPSVSQQDQTHYEKLRKQYTAVPSVQTMDVSE